MFIAVLSAKQIFLFLLLPRARPLFIMHVEYNSRRTLSRLTPGNTLIYKPSPGRKRTRAFVESLCESNCAGVAEPCHSATLTAGEAESTVGRRR